MNQNEPFFLNLYMRDTEKPKTFVVSNNFRIFARRFCVSYIEIQMNVIKKRT